MRVKGFVSFKSKLSRSCNKFVSIFRFRLKKPVFIQSLLNRSCHFKIKKQPPNSGFFSGILRNNNKKKKKTMNRLILTDKAIINSKLLQTPPRTPGSNKLFPSPLRPAIVRKAEKNRILMRDEAVEEACKSFENYLVRMIVEEGKVEDLMDIEELLYCWRNLKSPVFVDLVSRFYGELCKDLFSTGNGEEIGYAG